MGETRRVRIRDGLEVESSLSDEQLRRAVDYLRGVFAGEVPRSDYAEGGWIDSPDKRQRENAPQPEG